MRLPGAWTRLQRFERAAAKRRARIRAVAAAPGASSAMGRILHAIDPTRSARLAGLRYVNDARMPGIRRVGGRSRVRYVGPDGRPVTDSRDLARIRSLAIPPAWTEVWICPAENGHLQATGRDARGRKQYRYHPRWREVRDEVKYGRLVAFARALPRIRARTDADIRRRGLPREKVLAAVVQLLEKTLIRVGNEEYARHNGSIGLTTMRDGHAKIGRGKVTFEFRGKSGVAHAIDLEDRRLAAIVKACRDLPGYELFQYVDPRGRRQVIDSADVNAYLRGIAGEEFTAKDFRTWAGTVLAAVALAAAPAFKSNREATRNVVKAIDAVAGRLGNTKAVCRKCYIHPAVVEAYLEGAAIEMRSRQGNGHGPFGTARLSAIEGAVVRILDERLHKKSA